MAVKILKDAVILGRNDFILEDLRDELPSYMQTAIKTTWGEDFLDMDPADKIPEVDDAEFNLNWDDINVDKENLLLQLTGSITKSLYEEIKNDLRELDRQLKKLFYNLNLKEIYGYDDKDTFNFTIMSIISEIGRDAMYNSTTSIEKNLLDLIELIYDNKVNSINFNDVHVDEDKAKLIFGVYEDRKTSFNKLLNKLEKYLNDIQSGKREVNFEVKDTLFLTVEDSLESIAELKKIISSGALKSIIKNIIDKIDKINSGDVQLKLLISSKPEDFLRMAVSPFYSSCQHLHTGSYKKNLLANVFDKNSKIIYIIIDRPFEDCRGKQHPYTPIIRSILRKTNHGLALDNIYKADEIPISRFELIDLVNRKTNNTIEKFIGGTYEEDLVGNEKVLTLPPVYSDHFSVVSKKRSMFKWRDTLGEEEAKDLIEERVGERPEWVGSNVIIFKTFFIDEEFSGDDEHPLMKLQEFINQANKYPEKIIDIEDEKLLEYIEKYDIHIKLYKVLQDQYPEYLEQIRKQLNRPINPREDIEEILKSNNSFINSFKLDVGQEMITFVEKNTLNARDYSRYLLLIEIRNDLAHGEMYHVQVDIIDHKLNVSIGFHSDTFEGKESSRVEDMISMALPDIVKASFQYLYEYEIKKRRIDPEWESIKNIPIEGHQIKIINIMNDILEKYAV